MRSAKAQMWGIVSIPRGYCGWEFLKNSSWPALLGILKEFPQMMYVGKALILLPTAFAVGNWFPHGIFPNGHWSIGNTFSHGFRGFCQWFESLLKTNIVVVHPCSSPPATGEELLSESTHLSLFQSLVSGPSSIAYCSSSFLPCFCFGFGVASLGFWGFLFWGLCLAVSIKSLLLLLLCWSLIGIGDQGSWQLQPLLAVFAIWSCPTVGHFDGSNCPSFEHQIFNF